jgi:4-hydroxymandelate oxidase
MVSLDQLESMARAHLQPEVHAAISRGVGDSLTFNRNLEAWRRIELAPHVLSGVGVADLEWNVLGEAVATPILLAPAGLPRNAYPEGEIAAARGAAEARTLMVLSHFATKTIEEVAAAVPAGLRWFQLYLTKDRGYVADLLARARASSFKAIVLTVDSGGGVALEGGRRDPEWDLQPMRGDGVLDHGASTADIEWVKGRAELPVIVKGIVRADDARRAVAAGADAVLVSNHGGRALDGTVATAEALPHVVDAVGGRVEVYVDGGIRRGQDVIRAMALGAHAVFIGQPWVWAVCAGGAETLTALIHSLNTELVASLAMCGIGSLRDIGPDVLWSPRGREPIQLQPR